MKTLAEFVRSTPFFVIAHRGASGEAPENTISAIRLAIEGGAAMIEIDVQTTLDKELVVFHDKVLGRTTNGHGHIRQISLKDLSTLDAGSWFDERYAGEVVPRLDDVLDLIKGQCYVNIELKPLSELDDAERYIETLIGVIQDRDLAPYSLLSSFDHKALQITKAMDPTIHTAALNVPGDTRLPSEIVSDCGADGYGCSMHEITRKRSEDLATHRIPWGVYSVDSVDALRKALDHGVNSVVTKHPSLIRDAYKEVAT
jgi:glycerophosphoryl diester phosphodiesterase